MMSLNTDEMSLPPFSNGAQNIIDNALAVARDKGHTLVATEHLAFALCNSSSRAVTWAAYESYPDEVDPVRVLRDRVSEWLESRPLFRQSAVAKDALVEPEHSAALKRVINVAAQIGSGPIEDGGILYENGLIASEYLFAGLLVEGTGVGADAFTRLSKGRVNWREILKAFEIDEKRFLRPDASEGKWKAFEKGSFKRAVTPWVPPCSFYDLSTEMPPAPTDGSNWLIPSKLIIGEHPSKRDVSALIDAGIDTFVSLIGEYDLNSYTTNQYPSTLLLDGHKTVDFVHFPVRDFNVVSHDALMCFVHVLKRQVFEGHTLYIHCRGGHG